MRFTKNRKKVLEILKNADKPLRIEQIMNNITEEINLSTVYRAVDYLEKNAYIESASFSKNVRFFFCKSRFRHFLYCKGCSKIQIFNECAAKTLEKAVLKQHNFQIHSHVFYFTGLCDNCKGEV